MTFRLVRGDVMVRGRIRNAYFSSTFRAKDTDLVALGRCVNGIGDNRCTEPVTCLHKLVGTNGGSRTSTCGGGLPLCITNNIVRKNHGLRRVIHCDTYVIVSVSSSPVPILRLLHQTTRLSCIGTNRIDPSKANIGLFVVISDSLGGRGLTFKIIGRHIRISLPNIGISIDKGSPGHNYFTNRSPGTFCGRRSRTVRVPITSPRPRTTSKRSSKDIYSNAQLSGCVSGCRRDGAFITNGHRSCLIGLSSILGGTNFSLCSTIDRYIHHCNSTSFPTTRIRAAMGSVCQHCDTSRKDYTFRPSKADSIPGSTGSTGSTAPFPGVTRGSTRCNRYSSVRLSGALLPYFSRGVCSRLPPLLASVLGYTCDHASHSVLLVSSLALLDDISPNIGNSLNRRSCAPTFCSVVANNSKDKGKHVTTLRQVLRP